MGGRDLASYSALIIWEKYVTYCAVGHGVVTCTECWNFGTRRDKWLQTTAYLSSIYQGFYLLMQKYWSQS